MIYEKILLVKNGSLRFFFKYIFYITLVNLLGLLRFRKIEIIFFLIFLFGFVFVFFFFLNNTQFFL